MSAKEEILSLLEAFASTERMESFFVNNATPDFLFIRPSGNPIDAEGFQKMWYSGDLVLESAEITKVHRFELLGADAAMCVFTLGSKFTYKGTQNDDLPTVTSIFKKDNSQWKVAWMQRSSGQSDMTLWNK
tara:strand:- start:132 stop:524 length:393 start_codon:yes stop_codon:yes gene_type:complete